MGFLEVVIKILILLNENQEMERNEHRILTDAEAYDVAAYINNYDKKRPVKKGRENDFPDVKVKVPDSDIGPYLDDKSTTQHKFGPYKGIIIPAQK